MKKVLVYGDTINIKWTNVTQHGSKTIEYSADFANYRSRIILFMLKKHLTNG